MGGGLFEKSPPPKPPFQKLLHKGVFMYVLKG